MSRVVGFERARCRYCGDVINLRGTPKQVLFRMRMHFEREEHSNDLRREVDDVVARWEKLSEDEKMRVVEELLRKHFEEV